MEKEEDQSLNVNDFTNEKSEEKKKDLILEDKKNSD